MPDSVKICGCFDGYTALSDVERQMQLLISAEWLVKLMYDVMYDPLNPRLVTAVVHVSQWRLHTITAVFTNLDVCPSRQLQLVILR